jgi:signal transduction histidine kinase
MASKPKAFVALSALALGVFEVVGSYGASHNQSDRRSIDAFGVLLVVMGPLALARRDRWPLVAVGVTLASVDVYVGWGYAYGPIFAGVVVALFAAVQSGHRRSTWLLAAAGYVGFVVASIFDPHSVSGLVHLSLVAGWLVVALTVAEVLRTRREQLAQRERVEYEEGQRRIGEQRLHLAQELHDVLAHNISLINVQASVALHLLDEQPERARPALATIKETSRDALHELRTALDLIRLREEAPRSPAPRLADLGDLVDGVRIGGLDARLVIDGPVPTLPAAVELAAFRIIQEALTNVTRHAQAHTVTVRVEFADGVDIEVTDDGRGGSALPGNGITGMRERAAALGGRVEAGPVVDGGFRVTAHLPEVHR